MNDSPSNSALTGEPIAPPLALSPAPPREPEDLTVAALGEVPIAPAPEGDAAIEAEPALPATPAEKAEEPFAAVETLVEASAMAEPAPEAGVRIESHGEEPAAPAVAEMSPPALAVAQTEVLSPEPEPPTPKPETPVPVSEASAPEPIPLAPAAPIAPAALAGAVEADLPAPAAEAAVTTEAAPSMSAIGVLLVNLGTPEAADAAAVRRYLKEFLTDKRVIEKNSILWKMALNGIILPLRSRRKARDYRKIWNEAQNESPLKTITRSQAEKLAGILEPLGRHIVVDWAMRYGHPSLASRLEALIARGCGRILVMPLYPQYAAPTTATVNDEVFRYLMTLRRQPAIRILPPYYDDPYYIEVLASSLKAEIKALSFTPEVIVASYHGMPRDYVDKGDPYERHCIRTTELLREQLKLDENKLMMTFQSRFGRGKWLEPSTIKTMKKLAKNGVKNLVVMMPGFASDCLETLEEIAVENARVFKRHGGENFAAIPCLNDSEAGMLMIWQLAMRELKGWV